MSGANSFDSSDLRHHKNSGSGSEKGVFRKRGLFRKVHSLEMLENLAILEILESPWTVQNKRESDHFLEIPEI